MLPPGTFPLPWSGFCTDIPLCDPGQIGVGKRGRNLTCVLHRQTSFQRRVADRLRRPSHDRHRQTMAAVPGQMVHSNLLAMRFSDHHHLPKSFY